MQSILYIQGIQGVQDNLPNSEAANDICKSTHLSDLSAIFCNMLWGSGTHASNFKNQSNLRHFLEGETKGQNDSNLKQLI